MLTIDINNPREQCNLACTFCYSWNLEGQLCLSDIQGIVQEHSKDTLIELGGGEPFLHPEIAEVVAYLALEAERNVHIATNGTYLPDSVRMLPEQARRRTAVQISLHASNSELYGKIMGNARLFDKVLDNIPAFKELFPTTVNTVVYEENFEDIPSLVELVKSFAIPHRIHLALPIGRGAEVKLLSQSQIADVTSYLLAEKMNGTMIDSPLLHQNTCPALASAYGISKQGICPAEAGEKRYVSSIGIARCEFLPMQQLVQLGVGGV